LDRDSNHDYKVAPNLAMKPEAANAAIPDYGWENGTNIRWISIENVSSVWEIAAISTGP